MTLYSIQSEKFGLFPEEQMTSGFAFKDIRGKRHKSPNDNLICLLVLAYQHITVKGESSANAEKRLGKLQKYLGRLERFAQNPNDLKMLEQKTLANFFVFFFVNADKFPAPVN
jgi:hypothetical protein